MSADQNNRPKGRIKWYRSLGFRLPAAIALCCMIPTILFSLYTQRQTRRQVLDRVETLSKRYRVPLTSLSDEESVVDRIVELFDRTKEMQT